MNLRSSVQFLRAVRMGRRRLRTSGESVGRHTRDGGGTCGGGSEETIHANGEEPNAPIRMGELALWWCQFRPEDDSVCPGTLLVHYENVVIGGRTVGEAKLYQSRKNCRPYIPVVENPPYPPQRSHRT